MDEKNREDIRTVFDLNSRLTMLMADSSGVSLGSLFEMGVKGSITVDSIFDALAKIALEDKRNLLIERFTQRLQKMDEDGDLIPANIVDLILSGSAPGVKFTG